MGEEETDGEGPGEQLSSARSFWSAVFSGSTAIKQPPIKEHETFLSDLMRLLRATGFRVWVIISHTYNNPTLPTAQL